MFKQFINLPTSTDYNASELASWPPCLYVAPHLSPGLSPRFYVLECLGPDPPTASLVDLWSNVKLAVLDIQPALRDRLEVMASPQVHVLCLSMCHSCAVNASPCDLKPVINKLHTKSCEKCMSLSYQHFKHTQKVLCTHVYCLILQTLCNIQF
jgi:hypothetical protein